VNLSAIDLNLLVIFDALLAERSVTRAGTRVGLSQPAVSNALARLRATLDDPLLVRVGSSMEPTPRALEIAPAVQRALATLRDALTEPAGFDAAKSKRSFCLAAADDVELTLVPALLSRMKQLSPGIDLRISRAVGTVDSALRTGEVDLYIGAWFNVPSTFRSHLLRTEGFLCIAREDHPAIDAALTLPVYMKLGHVLVTPAERPGSVVDTALSDEDLGRRVVLRTPHFLVAPFVVARTDLIATLPRAVAETAARLMGLALYPPPIDVPGFPLRMVWHPRSHDQAAHRWLREQVMLVASDDGDW